MRKAESSWLQGRIHPFSPQEAFAGQVAMMLWVAFCCAAFGFAWGTKDRMPGLGIDRIRWSRVGFSSLVGLLLAVALFLLRVWAWREGIKMAVPDSVGAGMAELLHGAFFYEIVVRFGAISWMNRLIRRKTVSAVTVACLFALLGTQQARWLGWDPLLPGTLRFTYACLQLLTEVVLGLFFVRWGLWSTSLTHGILGLQGILLPLTLGRIS